MKRRLIALVLGLAAVLGSAAGVATLSSSIAADGNGTPPVVLAGSSWT